MYVSQHPPTGTSHWFKNKASLHVLSADVAVDHFPRPTQRRDNKTPTAPHFPFPQHDNDVFAKMTKQRCDVCLHPRMNRVFSFTVTKSDFLQFEIKKSK
mmetsp:Transcript_30245/g.69748  ORF Transcript_30245/g.69748 Transcript_30245/m.69748 type:complete len:99 (-) Transcript_30245:21-317(-)